MQSRTKKEIWVEELRGELEECMHLRGGTLGVRASGGEEGATRGGAQPQRLRRKHAARQRSQGDSDAWKWVRGQGEEAGAVAARRRGEPGAAARWSRRGPKGQARLRKRRRAREGGVGGAWTRGPRATHAQGGAGHRGSGPGALRLARLQRRARFGQGGRQISLHQQDSRIPQRHPGGDP